MAGGANRPGGARGASVATAPAPGPMVQRIVGLGELHTTHRGPHALTAVQLGELALADARAARLNPYRKCPDNSASRKRGRGAEDAAEATAAASTQQGGAAAKRRSAKTHAAAAASEDEFDEEGLSDDDFMDGKGDHAADTPEARRLRRLLRNRMAAQQARERKKQYINTLEDQITTLQQRLQRTEQALHSSEDQVATLRRIIMSMRGQGEAQQQHQALQAATPPAAPTAQPQAHQAQLAARTSQAPPSSAAEPHLALPCASGVHVGTHQALTCQ